MQYWMNRFFTYKIENSYVFLLLVSVFLMTSCIEPWESGIEEQLELISFDGSLIKGKEVQVINISRTTGLVDPKKLPLRDCEVYIQDNLLNEFPFEEVLDGLYEGEIHDEDLVIGRKYKLIAIAPSGARYESEYERLTAPVPIDSIYYEIEDKIDPITGNEFSGVQFYADVKATDTTSRYFRWMLDETWEYTVGTPISWIYDIVWGELEKIRPDNKYELFRCYKNVEIDDILLTNTINLASNAKKKVNLHYVSARTDKLRIKYSLFVKQYPINPEAYDYWNQNRIALQGPGGLYNTQPGQPITNMTNVNDSTEKVLGYFWASSLTSRRFTFLKPKELLVEDEFCELVEFDYITHIIDGTLPVYIYYDEGAGIEYTAPPACFDCQSRGGSLTKPDYW